MPASPSAPHSSAQVVNLPNAITTARLVLAVVLFAALEVHAPAVEAWAWLLFLVAAGTDFLDGYFARKYHLVTVVGRILDPFADKLIVLGTLVSLAARGAESGVTAPMVLLILGRELLITALRSFLEQAGRDFSAAWSGKVKMALQCAAITASLLSFTAWGRTAGPEFVWVRDGLLWGAVGVTVYSGVTYVLRAIALVRAGGG